MRQVINLVGKKYGRLTVIERGETDKRGQVFWMCHCVCGTEKVKVRGSNLRSGMTKSCGCLRAERIRAANSLPRGEASFNVLVGTMKRSAKRRGYTWNLIKEEVRELTSRPCFYCGATPAQTSSTANPTGVYIYNGLDRVDNTKDYIIDNIVPCCGICNVAKHTMTQDEFLGWISRVYKHSVLKEKDETLP